MTTLKQNKESKTQAAYADNASAESPRADEQQMSASEEDETKLTVYSVSYEQGVINKALEVAEGCNVEVVSPEESYLDFKNWLIAQLTSEKTCDIAFDYGNVRRDLLENFGEDIFAFDNNDRLSKSFFNFAVDYVTDENGQVFGVPSICNIVGLYFNKMIMEECGITESELENLSWDSFIGIAIKIREFYPNIYALPPLNPSTIQILAQSLGEQTFDEENKLMHNNGAQAIFEILQRLRDCDLIPAIIDENYNALDEYIKGNKCAFVIGAPWIYTKISNLVQDGSVWDVCRIPTSEVLTNQVSLGGSSWLVMRNGNEDRAFDFLTRTFGVSNELALFIAGRNCVPAWRCDLSEMEYDDSVFNVNVIAFLNSLGDEVVSFDFSDYERKLNENIYGGRTFFELCKEIVSGNINSDEAYEIYLEALDMPYDPDEPITPPDPPSPPDPPTPPTPAKLISIKITKDPNKTEYWDGETFDKTGMEVTANYDNGTSVIVDDYKICNENAKLTINSVPIIKYTFGGVTQITKVEITVNKRLEDESKVNQTELKYECSAGTASVNLNTGRLLFEYKDCGIGVGNYRIELSHIYNSRFEEEA